MDSSIYHAYGHLEHTTCDTRSLDCSIYDANGHLEHTTCDTTSFDGSVYDVNGKFVMPVSSEDVCDINTESTNQPTSG